MQDFGPVQKQLKRAWRYLGRLFTKFELVDHGTSSAAALAYFFMLALFPAAIFLVSLLPFLPIPHLKEEITQSLLQALPQESAELVRTVVEGVTQNPKGGLLSIGFLLTLWSSSSGLAAVMEQLNLVYNVKESRPFVKQRLTAIALTGGYAVLILGSFVLILFGNALHGWIAGALGDTAWLSFFFELIRWGIIIGMITLSFSIVYHYGPNHKQGKPFRFFTPGSVTGTALFIFASLGFRAYISSFGDYNATYGSLGAAIILMLWLYIMGIVILLGSEINNVK